MDRLEGFSAAFVARFAVFATSSPAPRALTATRIEARVELLWWRRMLAEHDETPSAARAAPVGHGARYRDAT